MKRRRAKSLHGTFSRTRRIGPWAVGSVLLLMAFIAGGCADSDPDLPYLVRIGDDTVSVIEYRKALELAQSAYPHSELQIAEVDRAIRVRVLRELTEELILRQRARELGLSVTEEEMAQRQAAIAAQVGVEPAQGEADEATEEEE